MRAPAPETLPAFLPERFHVVRRVGEGSSGIVYEAFDRELRRPVALKTLRATSADRLLALKREFRETQDIAHPNLVRLGELFEAQGQWFFTMELVPGADFFEALRPATPATPLDVPRLEDALAQLTGALSALHAAGKVHLDVKPSNVLVAPDGRVVLLDFGLLRDVRATTRSDGGISGTAYYMAPEQVEGEGIGPAADWYAVGVMLFQVLTGRLPFEGPMLQVLERKLVERAPSARATDARVPATLDALCSALLAPMPTTRASARDVLAAIGVDTRDRSRTRARERPFVGRTRELEALRASFDAVSLGACRAVVLRGVSGVGKSALARAFVERIRGEGAALVLSGRCYERESVPYKGVDAVVDELARTFENAEPGTVPWPADADLLASVFPVLEGPVGSRAPGSGTAPNPVALRGRVFEAFRELVAALARRRPVVLAIDDLQWADTDSLRLLSHLLANGGVPGVLVLATARHGEQGESTLPGATEIAVGELPEHDARVLAESILGSRATEATIATLLRESSGHPLFLDELSRQLDERSAHAHGVRLDDALWARIRRLEDGPRALLLTVCVAGVPTKARVLATATGLSLADVLDALASLRAGRLARSGGSPREPHAEPYHDRVRESVLAHLPEPELRRVHRALAEALEGARDEDYERLLVHWEGALEAARAAHYAELAAERASRAFAFARAAALYDRALAFGPRPEHEVWQLARKRADALTYAGRVREAALAYAAALKVAPAEARNDVRRRYAEQLLYSGNFDDGLAILRAVLLEDGLALSNNPVVATLRSVARRIAIAVRGQGYTPRSEAELPPDVLARIDAAWLTGATLSQVDTVTGAEFSGRHLWLCLEAGEPLRISRALGLDAAYLGAVGPPVRAWAYVLVEKSRVAAHVSGRPDAQAFSQAARAFIEFFAGEWRTCADGFEASVAAYAAYGHGEQWILDTIHAWQLSALAFQGRLHELAARLPAVERDFRDRGDVFLGSFLYAGEPNLFWLATEGSAQARELLEGMRPFWARSVYTVQHLVGLMVSAQIHLFDGRGAQALAEIDTDMPAMLARVHFPFLQYARVRVGFLRANAALAAALEGHPPRKAARIARAHAWMLRGEGRRWTESLGDLVDGSASALLGDWSRSRTCFERAAKGFDACDMALHAAVARLRWGELVGGPEGGTAAKRARSDLREHGVREIDGIVRLLAPGPFDGARRR